MTGAITQIDITAKDSTAAAFASVNNNLDSLSSSTSKTVAALAGLGISVGGIAASIKSAIDAADEVNKLSQKIGVAVEDIAGLELAYRQAGLGADALQTSISKLSKNVASGNEAFAAMGISLKGADGDLKSTRQILAEVSDKFAGYQDGIAKTALAIELFGKSGADLIPFLNAGSDSLREFDETAQKLGLTLSSETAKRAEQFNDTLDLIGQGASGVTRSVAAELLPTLVGLSEQFFKTATDGDKIKTTADIISASFRGLATAGVAVVGTFQTVGTALGGIAAMWGAIAKGDFSQAREIVQQVKKDLADNFKSTIDGVTSAWSANNTAVQESTKSTQERIKQQAPLVKSLNDEKTAIDGRNKAQAFALDREHEYIKLLEIERKQRADLLKPYADSTAKANEQLDALENEITALKFAKENQIDLRLAVEKTTIARLEEKRAAQQDPEIVSQINSEIEARKKIAGLIPLQKELQNQTQSTTDQVTELWKQAGRNIQTTLASSIFDFFNGGLGNMVQNVKNAVLRIASEFAALKISQAIGLDKIFSVGAAGPTAAGISSGGSLLNIASLGSSAIGLVRGGFGANSLVGGALSFLPGEVGAFGSGLAGGAIAGVSSPAALAGASFAAMSGPLIAAFAATQGLKMLAGNKRMGGTFGGIMNTIGDIPILGDMIPIIPILNGLFGRGPLKQKETQLTGDIGASGLLSGYLTTNFKAKGGLLVGSKRDFAGVDLLTGAAETDNGKLQGIADGMVKYAQQLAQQINQSVSVVNTSLRGISDSLSLSVKPLDDFHHSINLISESGKALTDEQIAQEISDISDEMVKSLMPAIEQYAKFGESSIQTITRLGAEFDTLTNSASLLFDKTNAQAKDFVNSFGIKDRTTIIDKLGGVDSTASLTAGYAQNFLSEDQRMRPVIEALVTQRDKLGLGYINTRQQYIDAVQSGYSGKLNVDQFSFLLKNQDLINQGFNYLGKFNDAINETADSASKAARELKSMNADDTENGQRLNKAIQDTTASISELESISKSLQETVNQINPLSLEQARSQVSSGNFNAPNLQQALSVLSNTNSAGFPNVLDFRRARASNVSAIGALQGSVDYSLIGQRNKLAATIREKEDFQAALNRASLMYQNDIASFDVGGKVPRTGLALIHKDEQVVTARDSASFAEEIASLKTAIEVLVISNNKINRRFDKWDSEGMPAVRTA